MVKKVQVDDIKIVKELSSSENSTVYRTMDGSVLKVFSPFLLKLYEAVEINLEEKIVNSKKIESVPEIVTPTSAVYDRDSFIGYTMKHVKGNSYKDLESRLTIGQRANLKMYAHMHRKLESIVVRGNSRGVVFPDLCTTDNIMITDDGRIRLIDYDGLQVGKYKSVGISTNLGDCSQYMIPKYQENFLFNSNLDKKSLIELYFLDALNINLEMVGQYNPYIKRNITLDDIFEQIGLDDNDVKHKVWKCFDDKSDNEFLGSDVDRIADQYKLVIFPQSFGKCYIKKLVRR